MFSPHRLPRRPGRTRGAQATGAAALVFILLAVFAGGLTVGHFTGTLPWGKAKVPVLDASPPMRLSIPSLQVRAPIHGVGLARDGTIAPPDVDKINEAGWYKQ